MLQRIETALEYAAVCVAQHGEAYLPLFLRLEQEAESFRVKETALERAMRAAGRR